MFARFSSALDTLLALQDSVEAARTPDYFGMGTSTRRSYPSVNLFQNGDDTVLMAEVPGMKKEEVKIQIKDDLITISGDRKVEYPEKASVHRVERRGVSFNRTLKVPVKVDVNKVTAEYVNGVLKVVLPRAESDKPRMIDIN